MGFTILILISTLTIFWGRFKFRRGHPPSNVPPNKGLTIKSVLTRP